MNPSSARQPCLWATSNSEFVSSQRGLEVELLHCSDDADGLGRARMSEPGLGVERLEGGGQGPGVQRRVPHFFNSCKKLQGAGFPPVRAQGARRAS